MAKIIKGVGPSFPEGQGEPLAPEGAAPPADDDGLPGEPALQPGFAVPPEPEAPAASPAPPRTPPRRVPPGGSGG